MRTRSIRLARCLALVGFGVCVGSSLLAAALDETPAERGFRFLTTKPYFQREFDTPTFDDLWTVWEEPARGQAESADAATRHQLTLARYGLQPMPGRESGVPLQYVETADGGWVTNCFSCHGGKVAGQVIPGLPNSHVALATIQEDLHKWRVLNNHLDQVVDNGMPGVPLGGSNGTTNAVMFGVALGQQRDLQLNFFPRKTLIGILNHDHDAPAWWNVKRKKMLYADGFAPKTHRALMPFLLLPQTGPEKFTAFENDFKDILAYIESIPVPKYPFSIDQTLAAQGQVAFNRVCAECHGTYGPGGEYPERNIDLEVVGTDPLRWRALTSASRAGHQLSWFGEYGKHRVKQFPKGYVAPPLDGVWATAPYLHNGSIPTLWALFHTDQRPVIWTRTEDGYDQVRVGLEFTEVSEIPADADTPAERRRYFDTRIAGKSTAGHEFPEQLSEAEKTAVIEYLKTL